MCELIKELKQEKMYYENKIKDDQHRIKLLDYSIKHAKKSLSRDNYKKAIKELKERKKAEQWTTNLKLLKDTFITKN